MNELTKYTFTNSTGDDQLNYFSGEFSSSLQVTDVVSSRGLEEGTYRIVDGELFQITAELPSILWEYGYRDPSGAAERLISLISALQEKGLLPWYKKNS